MQPPDGLTFASGAQEHDARDRNHQEEVRKAFSFMGSGADGAGLSSAASWCSSRGPSPPARTPRTWRA